LQENRGKLLYAELLPLEGNPAHGSGQSQAQIQAGQRMDCYLTAALQYLKELTSKLERDS